MTEAEKELVASIKLELMRPIAFMNEEELLKLVKKAILESEVKNEIR
jgi:hypothetical protein